MVCTKGCRLQRAARATAPSRVKPAGASRDSAGRVGRGHLALEARRNGHTSVASREGLPATGPQPRDWTMSFRTLSSSCSAWRALFKTRTRSCPRLQGTAPGVNTERSPAGRCFSWTRCWRGWWPEKHRRSPQRRPGSGSPRLRCLACAAARRGVAARLWERRSRSAWSPPSRRARPGTRRSPGISGRRRSPFVGRRERLWQESGLSMCPHPTPECCRARCSTRWIEPR